MALKKGSSGEEVVALQEALNRLGFGLEVDGANGDKTHKAVVTVQMVFGYDVDGIAGPASLKLIDQQASYGWNLQAARKAFVKPQGQA